MPKITNTSPRMLHMGGVMCPPGVAVDVPEDLLKRQVVKDMIDAGELAVGADAEKAEASLQQKAAAQADGKKA